MERIKKKGEALAAMKDFCSRMFFVLELNTFRMDLKELSSPLQGLNHACFMNFDD